MATKQQDCYFYYYSKCTKDNCVYRHEPAALGCEVTCLLWQQGNCVAEHCNFRHMELKKNRKAIPCYWEKQPSGCTKPHCSFLHSNPRPGINTNASTKAAPTMDLPSKPANQEWLNRKDDAKFDNSATESDQGRVGNDASSFIPSVDAVIVNFEESMRLY